MIEVGTKAPEFTLYNGKNEQVSLADFKGKKIVVYFYPKDNTPGCTKQACAYAGAFQKFKDLDIVVIGISKDSVASHEKFATKFDLPFILLSDPELVAIKGFDVWKEKTVFGKIGFGIVRATFVIDENGIVEKVMPRAKPDTNAQDILNYLEGNK